MEKTVYINGEAVVLKASFKNAIIYRSNFNKEFIKTFYGITKKSANTDEFPCSDEDVLQLTWTLARTYDPDLMPFEDWENSLEDFPIMDIFPVVIALIASNFTTTTNIESGKKVKGAER